MATREERREEAREERRQGISAGCIACALGTFHEECAADGPARTPGCPGCALEQDHDACRKPGGLQWRDVHGDVWWEATDDLLHGVEVAPFARAHVEKKWGPLTLIGS